MTTNLPQATRKIISGAAALALMAGAAVVTAQPAAARPWHHHWHHGFWPGAVAAGIVGGAIAAATSPFRGPDYYGYDEYPAYGYGPPPAAAPSGVGYCEAHYRSYNPETGTYLGYDGAYHPCP